VLQAAHLLQRGRLSVGHIVRRTVVGGDQRAEAPEPFDDDLEHGGGCRDRHILL
jgi:hypothetical protein